MRVRVQSKHSTDFSYTLNHSLPVTAHSEQISTMAPGEADQEQYIMTPNKRSKTSEIEKNITNVIIEGDNFLLDSLQAPAARKMPMTMWQLLL